MHDKVKMLLILAIVFSAMGIYNVGKAAYVAMTWNKTEGTVVDTPQHTWRCGKGISECYTINVGFYANNNFITIDSEKTFSDAPRHLLDKKVSVYFPTADPHKAVLAGTYGSQSGGFIALFAGALMFAIWLVMRQKK
ncbi:MAG: hypothetical protein ACPHLK_07995 [Gammaproteobacteria bacterium]|jgi:hypothetical protein